MRASGKVSDEESLASRRNGMRLYKVPRGPLRYRAACAATDRDPCRHDLPLVDRWPDGMTGVGVASPKTLSRRWRSNAEENHAMDGLFNQLQAMLQIDEGVRNLCGGEAARRCGVRRTDGADACAFEQRCRFRGFFQASAPALTRSQYSYVSINFTASRRSV